MHGTVYANYAIDQVRTTFCRDSMDMHVPELRISDEYGHAQHHAATHAIIQVRTKIS